jgi:hypothetical protein
MHTLLNKNVKNPQLKHLYKGSYMFRSIWIYTGYTHSLNHTTDSILTLYFNVKTIFKKNNFSKDQHELPEDGPYGPKHVGAFIQMF